MTKHLLFSLFLIFTGSLLAQERVEIHYNYVPVGIGAHKERLATIKIINKEKKQLTIDRITLSLENKQTIKALKQVTLYKGHSKRFDPTKDQKIKHKCTHKKTIQFKKKLTFNDSIYYLFITGNLSKKAKYNETIKITIDEVNIHQKSTTLIHGENKGRNIVLTNKLLWHPGYLNSKSYRIPAITTTKKNTLIAAIDKRNTGHADLFPENDIDIVIKRSEDNGKTWSKSIYVFGENTAQSMSDPSLVTLENGNIILMANMGQSFWYSKNYNPNKIDKTIRPVVCISKDDGKTWSKPIDLAPMIYAIDKNLIASFISSGALLQVKHGKYKGRIMGVLVGRYSNKKGFKNHIIYSDNNGESWQLFKSDAVSGLGGDEAKVVDLKDGTILISSRKRGARVFNTSNDGGRTWNKGYIQKDLQEPACNGDLIRYSSNFLLHSIPFNARSRKNVSVLHSKNDGKTWKLMKEIYAGNSSYSALNVLSDNTIGIVWECGEYENEENDIYFTRIKFEE